MTYLKKFVNLKTIGHHFLCLFLLLPPPFILERYFHVKICYFHVKILFTYTFFFFKFWFENITPLFILPFLLSLSGSHVLCVSRIIIIILSYLFFVCFDGSRHYLFFTFVLSLPCKTLCLSRLLLFLFLSFLSFWMDPSTIYFSLLRALTPMQDLVSLSIIIIIIFIYSVFLDGSLHYLFFAPSCFPSHAGLCVSTDYYYFYSFFFCLFGWTLALFLFYSLLSLPCRTLGLLKLYFYFGNWYFRTKDAEISTPFIFLSLAPFVYWTELPPFFALISYPFFQLFLLYLTKLLGWMSGEKASFGRVSLSCFLPNSNIWIFSF